MKDDFKKTRLLLMLVSGAVALTCFILGVVWVRALHNLVDQSRLDDAGREIRGRMLVIKQLVSADLGASNLLSTSGTGFSKLPDTFDVAVLYSESRTYMAGLQRIGKERTIVPLNVHLMNVAIPGDSAFFDRAASEGSVSGLLVFEGRPLMIGIKRVTENAEHRGFVLAGRWLDPRKLAPTAGLAEQAFDLFVPDERASLPADVEAARLAMTSDQQFFGRLQRRGAGVGYLRFDDVFERTAFILRFPWIDAGGNSERRSVAWLLATCVLVGLLLHAATSMSISWIEKQRRRSPGLAGMTDKELREMTESFPGYVFTVNQKNEYVGVSRALAGVSGKESSYFVGRLFGSVSGEVGMSPGELMNELADSRHWPSTKSIEFSIAGLKEQFSYLGSCHFIAGKRCLFVVLQANDRANVERIADEARKRADVSAVNDKNAAA